MADVLSRSQLFATSCGKHVRASCWSLDKKASSFVGLSGPSSTRYKSLRSSCCEGLLGRKVVVGGDGMFSRSVKGGLQALPVQMTLTLPKVNRWWEKGVQTNMKEISSAQDIVDSLRNAGEKLVIVDFFSPGCGGCRALHPKICQFAEANPEVIFLQVNYEEHKSMCYSLGVHVLPFFRFYRGAQGRLCSFSCTNATIKKFKDALAKHNTDRSSLGPAKGLEQSELLALAANKDLNFNYTSKPEDGPATDELAETIPASVPVATKTTKNEKAYVTAWR